MPPVMGLEIKVIGVAEALIANTIIAATVSLNILNSMLDPFNIDYLPFCRIIRKQHACRTTISNMEFYLHNQLQCRHLTQWKFVPLPPVFQIEQDLS